MVFIKEYRIILPLTLEEYHIGQLYTTMEMSKQETQSDSGVEILKNEPFSDTHSTGQYTRKQYHLGNKIPKLVATCAPKSALKLQEEAWNCYPHCKTILKNEYLGDKFELIVETLHAENIKRDNLHENIHNLSLEDLKHREIVIIDLSNGSEQIMCCYKLVTLTCNMYFIQSIIAEFIVHYQNNMFNTFHQQLLSTKDKWINLTINDIRELEEKTKHELASKISPSN
ncbi:MAG: putative amino acid/polyamine transporter I [Terrestrivirus sp.]|uniref:Putative amino acid/polyamine transporter I n=1 Tax=Terrestrivirus sp. TaxID=2487775 RepID=A0A3G4ZTJ7_9VIRU|nr:MAG: putative amino acid/polyamine transporter I [Terrestrivirus sp.]